MREMKPENSSNVKRVREWNNNLTVEFGNGVSYTYLDVSKEHRDGIFEAKSVGKFINKNLVKGYESNKETEESLELIDSIMETDKILKEGKSEVK